MKRPRWSKASVIFGCIPIGLCIGSCLCFWIAIIVHDYRPPKWDNDLSLLQSGGDIEATLESDLTVGQATRADVWSVLKQHGLKIEECRVTSPSSLECWIPAHPRITNPDDPWNIKDLKLYFLICPEASWRLIFHFENNALSKIEALFHGACL